MIIFFMLTGSSSERLKGIRPRNKRKAENLIRRFGGRIESMYTVLGKEDLLLISTFPGVEQAMKASAALKELTGIFVDSTKSGAMPKVPQSRSQ